MNTLDPSRVKTSVEDVEYDAVKNYFSRRLSCSHEVADLTQEAFHRMLGRKKDGAVKEPLRMLYRIARNLLIDRSRRGRTRPAFDSLDDPDTPPARDNASASPVSLVQARDDLDKLKAAIDRLPARCRDVFILSRFEGLSYAEIAARLSISPKTVEKHMAKAIQTCRDAWERE